MLRRLLERLARGSAFRRRLPPQFGNRPIYLSADSALSYLKPQWADASRSLLDAAAAHATKAKSIWDIGANCGVFTLAAAHVAAPDAEILAVEADPFLAALLQKSTRDPANSDRSISVLCAAVSDHNGVARFLIASRGRSSNSLEQSGHRSQAGGTRFIQHVATTTLDALLEHFSAPDLIKIDVEGAETMVLAGAEQLLSTVRPMLYIEVGEEQNAEVTTILHRHNYRLYDGDRADGVPLEACAFNTLAIPSDRPPTKPPMAVGG